MDFELEELAEELNANEVWYINHLVQKRHHTIDLRKEMERQVPGVEDIIADLTANQYFEQIVKVSQGLECTFRTLVPIQNDESVRYAIDRSKNQEDPAYVNNLARRRLAHGLININGKLLSAKDINGSMFDHINNDGFTETLKDIADTRMAKINVLGLFGRISEAYGVWDTVVNNRINGVEDLSETLKKSTRGTTSER